MPTKITVIPPGVTKWDGEAVLTAHGWMLLERFTGKRYSYRAVQCKTGDSKYLGHKKNPASEPERMAMLERFCTVPDAQEQVYCVDASGGALPREKLAQTLDYIVERVLPEVGYSLRVEQLALAQDIFSALAQRAVLLSEAGVGIGKTHAYLIAAALVKRGAINDFWLRGNYPGMAYIAKMPIVVATSSIALQKAIVRDYIPDISRTLLERGIIRTPLTCVIRKGKEHYLCDKRLHLLLRQTTDDSAKKLLAPLASGKGGIDLGEMDTLPPYIKRRISVKGRCGGCGWRDACRYHSFLEKAQSDKADFQICNHNYLLADTLHRASCQRPLIPHYQAIVIDEAHKFLQAARQMYGVSLSSPILPDIAKTIRSLLFCQGQSTAELWRDADKLASQAAHLFLVLRENVPSTQEEDDEVERFTTEIDSAALRRLRNLSALIDRLIFRLKSLQPLQKYEGLCSNARWELGQAKKPLEVFLEPDTLVYWLEKPKTADEVLLCAIPKRLGASLHADLWRKGVPIVLTSGTMAAGNDFTYVKLGLGLDRLAPGSVRETVRPSPFDYSRNVLIYISERVPFPDSRDGRYIAAVADELERLIRAAHGHTAALFTSYRVMEKIFAILKRRSLPFSLFLLERGGLNTIERFRQSGNGVLFASGSMWEGVDLPGDILSLLVIVKLPFAVPDPINEHERTLFPDGDAYKRAVIVPEMLVKLKQGFGRLIRCEGDTGIVALLDSRVRAGGSYRAQALSALPDCRVTSDLAAVTGFLREKKPSTYFEEGS